MIRLENVSKMYWRHLWKMSWGRFEDVFNMSWQDKDKEDKDKTSLRRLQDVFKMSSRRLEYVLKTCWRHLILKKFWKHVEDVFWRHMAKANIFVLIKMSWRCLDVFKTSSSRMFAGIDVPKKTTQSSKENSFAGVYFYKDAGLQSQVLNSN